MIVNLTARDRAQIEKIEAEYDQKIAEIEALIEKIAPPEELDEKKERELQKKRPKMPKPIEYTDDGTPVYDQEALRAWQLKNDKINAEINRIFDEWLASGSQEWRDARSERIRLITAKSEAFSSYYRKIELREFSKLGGDRDKIIQSAREQINLMIENRFMNYQKLIETHLNENGEEISGFSARDLRVDEDQIYLDSSTIVKDCDSLLRLHFEALRDDQDSTKQISDMIFKIVADSPKTSSDKGVLGATISFKKKRKARSTKKLPTFTENQDFFMFSTTQAKDIFFNLLSSDGDVKETAQKMNAVSKRKQAKIFTGENSRALQVETDNSQTIVEILGSACQKVNSRTAKKILHFVESELYQRTYYKGKMNDDVVTFPLQKLVDKKLYTSVQNARRAFYDASNVLTALRVSATLKSGKKEVSISDGNARVVLFPTMLVENCQCFVRLNKDINWSPFLKDFFLMPDSWWALPDNASDLEYKIFRSVRLNKEKLDRNGVLVFNISLSTVATWLNLPLNTKNPKRNVKDPIETAVKQISDSLGPNNFKIEIKTDLNASLTQYLSGYLEITIGGVYTQNLIGINEKQTKRIEQAVRRKDAIIKEASIRKLTEQMKEDEKTEPKSAE